MANLRQREVHSFHFLLLCFSLHTTSAVALSSSNQLSKASSHRQTNKTSQKSIRRSIAYQVPPSIRNLVSPTSISTRARHCTNNNRNDDNNNNIDDLPSPIDSSTMGMRAWTCHGRNQRDLVDKLCLAKIVTTPKVRDVLYKVDRKNYAPVSSDDISAGDESSASMRLEDTSPRSCYMDAPQPIGFGQTISAPHMHAHVLEEMYPYLTNSPASEVSILDVGCGSGYLTAALGRWVDINSNNNNRNNNNTSIHESILGKPGKVYGMDVYPELVERTVRNLQKEDFDLLDSHTVDVQVGDGWEGLPLAGPFDAIHVGAAANEFPINLMMQLRVGGVLIVPVGPRGSVQVLYKVERLSMSESKSELSSAAYQKEAFSFQKLLGVRYVPLVHPS